MLIFQRRLLASAIGCAALNLASVNALAQTEEMTKQQLEEVIVTVERREQSLQDLAGVAQAFDQDALDRLGVGANIKNLQNIVPGLNIANQEGNVEIYIRGVGSSNNTELGDPAAASHLNGVYIPRPRGMGAMFHDVERVEIKKGPQGTLRGRNATAGSLNIVANKPQLDEFSGNAEISVGNYETRSFRGAVNIPVSDRFAVRLAGYSEEHDSYFRNASSNSSLEAAGNEDVQSLRLSALWDISDSTQLYLVLDQTKEGGTGYPGAQTRTALQNGLDFEDLDDPREVLYRGTEGDLDSTHEGVMATVTHDFGEVSLELSASVRDLDFEQTNASNDGVYFEGHPEVDQQNYSSQYWNTQSESQVYEVRLLSNNEDALSWTAGAFYFEEDQKAALFSTNDGGTWYSGTEWVMPEVESSSWAAYIDGTYDISEQLTVFAGLRYTEEEKYRYGTGGNWAFAFFGPGDEWGTALPSNIGSPGFEYDPYGRSSYDVTNVSRETMYQYLLEGVKSWGEDDTLDDQLTCVLDPACTDVTMPWGDGALPMQQEGKYKDNFTDYRLGASYQITDDSMVYATISTGHRSGGFNDSYFDANGDLQANPYSPEKLVMYELGSKNEFELNGLPTRLNASLFHYDYSDQVLQSLVALGEDSSATSLQNVNVANSSITGLELESRILLPYNLALDASALWLKTKVDSGEMADGRQSWGSDVPLVDLEGNELPLSPEFTLNLALSQTIETDIGVFDWIVSAQYKDDYFLSIWNDTDYAIVDGKTVVDDEVVYTDSVDGYVNVDIGLGFTSNDGFYRVELYGTNLTDEVYSNKGIIDHGNNLRFLNNPRTYGMRLKLVF